MRCYACVYKIPTSLLLEQLTSALSVVLAVVLIDGKEHRDVITVVLYAAVLILLSRFMGFLYI